MQTRPPHSRASPGKKVRAHPRGWLHVPLRHRVEVLLGGVHRVDDATGRDCATSEDALSLRDEKLTPSFHGFDRVAGHLDGLVRPHPALVARVIETDCREVVVGSVRFCSSGDHAVLQDAVHSPLIRAMVEPLGNLVQRQDRDDSPLRVAIASSGGGSSFRSGPKSSGNHSSRSLLSCS